jgi:hypothetical protein
MKIKSLRDVVIEEMQNDDGYLNFHDCSKIKNVYEKSSISDKIAIDAIFIRLVGYSLKTLIEKHENQTEE